MHEREPTHFKSTYIRLDLNHLEIPVYILSKNVHFKKGNIHKHLDIWGSSKMWLLSGTVLPAKSDSDDMFCLLSYKGLRIDRSLVY